MQYELNQYLIELCKNPKKEFIRFLSIENFTLSCISSEIINESNDTMSFIRKNNEEEMKNSDKAIDFVKSVWSSEAVIKINIKLSYSSFIGNSIYIISASHKHDRYTAEKNMDEIMNLTTRLRYQIPFVRFPDPPIISSNNQLTKQETEKLSDWIQLIINDVDLMCNDLATFFGCEFMEIFHCIFLINQNCRKKDVKKYLFKEQINFSITAKVPLYNFKIDKDLTITFHINLEAKLDGNVYTWEIDKE